MPELPEVETIRLGLQKYLVGHTILDVDIRMAKIFQGEKKNVIGAKITDIKRIGKVLIVELNNEFLIAIHLKLTGQLIYRGERVSRVPRVSRVKIGGELPNKFTHVIFHLDRNSVLYYNDMRKFGWIRIVENSKLKMQSFFKDLGPEPFKDLTFSKFIKIVQSSKTPIKLVLMDQKKIGGIGNIYANEALFDAGIDPRRPAKQISEEEAKKLYSSILKVLKNGIKYGGSSDVNFVNALGEDGSYQEHFLVYGRKGEKCRRCGLVIKKIKLGGRGTYFCPACQR
ncbi:MAG: bifunctional DNA-formamidopyrimidine glycosylase/DNA-(apurinic or apyrimidinic site) lyase [Candidatus Levybacteria bacterium]|nr:bifunctional DNA-formamidopyrimidine glycosylase/DNA-(apurinic or apyrimidinic site) lyase [Candidatus Levybacteria bacterium]